MESTIQQILTDLDEIYPYNNKIDFNIVYTKIKGLSTSQKLTLLENLFNKFDIGFNNSTCLSIPELWSDFEIDDWKTLILKMFPRKTKYIKDDLREINTGNYFDIVLLNRIIGISPFTFIFENKDIDNEDKKNFYQYVKYYGNTYFYNKERELIEDIVNYYELDVFKKIVLTKEKLKTDLVFLQWYNHEEVCNLFKNFDTESLT
ncbi:hypothetical protein [Flavobacterium oreochromis]|nr:hypothetical protein [Flavobacterium oreochromis]OWP74127.1 hypothetical protein BWG23_14890 [Flavobacterium oreochromis]